jgi:hypothetical protein
VSFIIEVRGAFKKANSYMSLNIDLLFVLMLVWFLVKNRKWPYQVCYSCCHQRVCVSISQPVLSGCNDSVSMEGLAGSQNELVTEHLLKISIKPCIKIQVFKLLLSNATYTSNSIMLRVLKVSSSRNEGLN